MQEQAVHKTHTARWWRHRLRILRITEWQSIQHILVVVTAVTAICLGLALLFTPDRVASAISFSTAVKVAPPTTWGIVFILAGIALASCYRRIETAELAALAVSGVFALWGVLTIFPLDNGGLLTAPVAYLGLSAFSAVTSIACGLRPAR